MTEASLGRGKLYLISGMNAAGKYVLINMTKTRKLTGENIMRGFKLLSFVRGKVRLMLGLSSAYLFLTACASTSFILGPSGMPTGDFGAEPTGSAIIQITESKLESCQDSGTTPDGRKSRYACVSVMFGTNREDTSNPDLFYGKAALGLNQTLQYGEVVISIPNKHQPGAVISGAQGPVDADDVRERQKVFAVWDGKDGVTEMNASQFKALTRHKLTRVTPEQRKSFVFIHGYNTSFEGAAYRTAQLKSDLGIKAPVYFFSWPSNANTKQYISDQDDADLSVDALVEFLKTVKSAVGPDTDLNLIAHSLGNRVLGKALDQMREEASLVQPMFNLGIFASADLDERLFKSWIGGEGHQSGNLLVKRGVLYVTDDDKALWVSRLLRQPACIDRDEKYRVGLVTKKACNNRRRVSMLSEPFETVDLSEIPNEKRIDIFENNHAKFVDSPRTICHLNRLFYSDKPVSLDKPNYFREVPSGSSSYWIADNYTSIVWERDCNGHVDNPFLVSALNR